MKVQILVTATGQDRPGIVARLTEVFAAHGGNLEESRMALLGGEFAAIMLVTVEGQRGRFARALADLKAEDISVVTKITAAQDSRFSGCIPLELTVSGADHEGIVHRITRFLREKTINIQFLESEVIHAPETATPLFCMQATLQVPPSLSISDLARELAAIGESESVEIGLSAAAAAVGR